MIVQKFGGTSVQDAEAIARLVAIVRGEQYRHPVVVVSAMGRTTNQLLECAGLARAGRLDEALAYLEVVAAAHYTTVDIMCLGSETEEALLRIRSHFETAVRTLEMMAAPGSGRGDLIDALSAIGELASSSVIAGALRAAQVPARWVDIRPLMVTGDEPGRAPVLLDKACRKLRHGFMPLIEADAIPVTQGFIGSTAGGITTTIGRGGSDYSAAIVGAALEADEIQIWTDVDGVMTTDPRIVPAAAPIVTLSFSEAAELAYFGAKVLHPLTLRPAMEKDIPVRVLNSQNPDHRGTTIVHHADPTGEAVRAIAVKKGITVLKIASDRMLMAYGFLARLFDVFHRHHTAIDMLATSEVSVSMTLDDTRRLDPILEELRTLGDVNVAHDQAIVCLVGDRLKTEPSVVARVFSSVRDLPVSMISHGASAINLSFVVPADMADRAVGALHAEFFAPVHQDAPVGSAADR